MDQADVSCVFDLPSVVIEVILMQILLSADYKSLWALCQVSATAYRIVTGFIARNRSALSFELMFEGARFPYGTMGSPEESSLDVRITASVKEIFSLSGFGSLIRLAKRNLSNPHHYFQIESDNNTCSFWYPLRSARTQAVKGLGSLFDGSTIDKVLVENLMGVMQAKCLSVVLRKVKIVDLNMQMALHNVNAFSDSVARCIIEILHLKRIESFYFVFSCFDGTIGEELLTGIDRCADDVLLFCRGINQSDMLGLSDERWNEFLANKQRKQIEKRDCPNYHNVTYITVSWTD